ncbi:hypothetical protein C0993_004803 [Termitomyces sp. T159_Od127]|nr:hypothetical protein C0993_004803 [Termitomyces sp. T159_Od127]
MSNDELAEINGIKPKIYLLDGEEKETSSTSSNSSGHPVNARTCKHIKSLFGDRYEEARLKLKNPNGPLPKSTAKKSSSAPKAKATSKRRKDDEREDEEDCKPVKKARSTTSARSSVQRDGDNDTRKGRKPASRKKKADGDDQDNEEDEKPAKKVRKPAPEGGKDQEDEDDNTDKDDECDDAPTSNKVIPRLLLANKWDVETGPDPTGWWISEKLDGLRTYYDGKDMISRLGNPFTPPKWFLEKLPKDVSLDGELFGGRGEFQSTVSIVKTLDSPHWKNITFQIFDIPSKGHLAFEERIEILERLFGPDGDYASDVVNIVKHEKATSRQHVLDKLREIESLGGEGLMLRKPASEYEGSRSGSLLKIKTFYDAEAIVIGYVPGKGRHQGSTGALKCKMQSGKTFSVGTGLSDKQRKNPPKIGVIITYRFQELTRDDVPRFPSYIGEAFDKDEAKDAEIPKHRLSGRQPRND